MPCPRAAVAELLDFVLFCVLVPEMSATKFTDLSLDSQVAVTRLLKPADAANLSLTSKSVHSVIKDEVKKKKTNLLLLINAVKKLIEIFDRLLSSKSSDGAHGVTYNHQQYYIDLIMTAGETRFQLTLSHEDGPRRSGLTRVDCSLNHQNILPNMKISIHTMKRIICVFLEDYLTVSILDNLHIAVNTSFDVDEKIEGVPYAQSIRRGVHQKIWNRMDVVGKLEGITSVTEDGGPRIYSEQKGLSTYEEVLESTFLRSPNILRAFPKLNFFLPIIYKQLDKIVALETVKKGGAKKRAHKRA